MKRCHVGWLTLTLVLAPLGVAAGQQAPAPKDVASIDAILASLYDVISGPAGQQRNWDRMRSLFYPGARLIPTRVKPDSLGGGAEAILWTVDDYVTRAGSRITEVGFFEREVGRQTEEFGNVAHAFSTYESRHKADEAQAFQRGINSIQLLKDQNRWWIVNIFWDAERKDNPIPAKYLSTRR